MKQKDSPSALAAEVAAVRSFNRYYTSLLGLLEETLLASPLTLPQVRVLWEVRASPGCRAEELLTRLTLDRGYLSRLLNGLEKGGYVVRVSSTEDRRVREVRLTAMGEAMIGKLDAAATRQIRELVTPLSTAERRRLVEAMGEVKDLLTRGSAGNAGTHTSSSSRA